MSFMSAGLYEEEDFEDSDFASICPVCKHAIKSKIRFYCSLDTKIVCECQFICDNFEKGFE